MLSCLVRLLVPEEQGARILMIYQTNWFKIYKIYNIYRKWVRENVWQVVNDNRTELSMIFCIMKSPWEFFVGMMGRVGGSLQGFSELVWIFLPSKPPPFLPSPCPKYRRSDFPNRLALKQHPIILSNYFKIWASYHNEQGPFCKIYWMIQMQECTCLHWRQQMVTKVKKVTTIVTKITTVKT